MRSRSIGRMVLLLAAFAALPGPVAGQNAPLRADDVVEALAGGMMPERLLTLARERCIEFIIDATVAARLRQAGATESFVSALREICNRSESLGPELTANERLARASALLSSRQNAAAEAQYREILRTDPAGSAPVFHNLALSIARQGRLSEAEVYFRLALQRDPMNESTREGLLGILRQQGKTREANALEAEFKQMDRESKAWGVLLVGAVLLILYNLATL